MLPNRTRKTNLPLICILVVFAALSLAYSLVTQLKYGPDEPAHFIYIRSLATTGSPPPISHTHTRDEASEASHEGHQPPLYYAIMAVPYALMNAAGLSSDTVWRFLRILGIAFGVAWIYWVYRLALEFFQSDSRALATTAFVALIPNSPYTAGVVSNDTLISLMFTWGLFYIVKFFRSGKLGTKQALALGLVMGLAALTKAQGLILIPVFAIAAVCLFRRGKELRSLLQPVAVALGTAALVSAWWFVRCRLVYGTPMPQSLNEPVLPAGLIYFLVQPVMGAKVIYLCSTALFTYFWTPYWLIWKFVHWPYYFWPIAAVMASAIAGLVLRSRRDPVDRPSLNLMTFTFVLMWALWLRYVLVVDKMANLQGRLMLPVASVVGIVAVAGFEGWLRSPRARKIACIAGAGMMLLANVGVILCAVAFYATGGIG